jgi:hypothetical protein
MSHERSLEKTPFLLVLALNPHLAIANLEYVDPSPGSGSWGAARIVETPG